MRPGHDECVCASCGTHCPGRFAGCDVVWAAGPPENLPVRPAAQRRPAVAPAPDNEEGRADGPGWLQGAFDEIIIELRALEETGRRQQQVLNGLARREDGDIARLVDLAEGLPPRVQQVLTSASAATEQERADRRAAEQKLRAQMERSRQVAEASTTELRREIVRLAAAHDRLAERLSASSDQNSRLQVPWGIVTRSDPPATEGTACD